MHRSIFEGERNHCGEIGTLKVYRSWNRFQLFLVYGFFCVLDSGENSIEEAPVVGIKLCFLFLFFRVPELFQIRSKKEKVVGDCFLYLL